MSTNTNNAASRGLSRLWVTPTPKIAGSGHKPFGIGLLDAFGLLQDALRQMNSRRRDGRSWCSAASYTDFVGRNYDRSKAANCLRAWYIIFIFVYIDDDGRIANRIRARAGLQVENSGRLSGQSVCQGRSVLADDILRPLTDASGTGNAFNAPES